MDGGFCANNPTLYAIADALVALKLPREQLRVVSVGVGQYPEKTPRFFTKMRWARYLQSVKLLQKTLEINTQSMDQLRTILFKDVKIIRISETFQQPTMATDLFEHNRKKLNELQQRGVDSFAKAEEELKDYVL